MSKSVNILPKLVIMLTIMVLTSAMSTKSSATEQTDVVPSVKETVDFERQIGNPDAKVTVIEYASLTCGHCANFHKTIFPELKRDFIDTGKINFLYRDFPLDRLALNIAHALRCLPPSRYFGTLSLVYEQQESWINPDGNLDNAKELLKQAGMTDEAFDACLANRSIENTLLQKQIEAQEKYKVSSTPTLVVNDEILRFRDYAALKAALEKALGE